MGRDGRSSEPGETPRVSAIMAALSSVLVPGLGQWLAGVRERGVAVLAAALGAVAALYWYDPTFDRPWLWLALALFWVVQAIDAGLVAAGRRPSTTRLVLMGALPIYLVGWGATRIEPVTLVTNWPRVQPLFRALVAPDLLARDSEDVTASVRVLTPCDPDGVSEIAPLDENTPSVSVEPACAPLDSPVIVTGAGWPAGGSVELNWRGPTGELIALSPTEAGAEGRFETEITIPLESVPARVRERQPELPQRQSLRASSQIAVGSLGPSETLREVMRNIGVTIALGFMATLFGAIFAIPLSLLGARNLMSTNRLTHGVYLAVRFLMNVQRSIESLILAVVFVVWVGQGPFAGVLALTVHTTAALGKLFSEAVESIDVGPIEAVRATGANWLQVVRYAVLPQVVPPFTAFTVYRWDINVRMSTIIGFVGGGGIGFLLSQWIRNSDWAEAATAVLVIAIVLIVLDQFSSTVRERLVEGKALMPTWARPIAAVLIVAFGAWAWRTAGIDLPRLFGDADKVVPIAGQLATPHLVTRDVEMTRGTAELVVPCGPELSAADVASSSAVIVRLGEECAAPGSTVSVEVDGLASDAEVRLRWLLPDGRRLSAGRLSADGLGHAEGTVEIRPILAEQVESFGLPVALQAEGQHDVGGLRASEPLRRSLGTLMETILMALMATTIGAVLSLPLSLLGARNIMSRTLLGNSLYRGARTFMNVARAIEPIILAAVFAAWVGYGSPFAGVMALVVVTVANLGKLFSEAVENIDDGPLEAIRATGANKAQEIAFGVVPQIVPPFIAFGIYHWDINVRISTIVGFVGGGGIGFVLREWMNQTRWSWAAVAILGIIVVVTAMDSLSARVRQRLV